jgi:IS5 family transposase
MSIGQPGLLAKAIRRIAATGRRIQAAGGAARTRLRAEAGKDEALAAVQRGTRELADLAEQAAHDSSPPQLRRCAAVAGKPDG